MKLYTANDGWDEGNTPHAIFGHQWQRNLFIQAENLKQPGRFNPGEVDSADGWEINRGQKMITHGELENGMKVWVEGYLFEVTNLRSYIEPPRERLGETEPVKVIRYTGKCVDRECSIANTAYDGGTYGAKADYPCRIEL